MVAGIHVPSVLSVVVVYSAAYIQVRLEKLMLRVEKRTPRTKGLPLRKRLKPPQWAVTARATLIPLVGGRRCDNKTDVDLQDLLFFSSSLLRILPSANHTVVLIINAMTLVLTSLGCWLLFDDYG